MLVVWVAIKALDNVLKSLWGRMKTLLLLEVRSSWLQILPNTHERGNLLIIISLAASLQADRKKINGITESAKEVPFCYRLLRQTQVLSETNLQIIFSVRPNTRR